MDIPDLIDRLTEAERAGGVALMELLDQVDSPELREILRKVAHDEGYWARALSVLAKSLGREPSTLIGDFAEKVRQVPDVAGKLQLLNRGQSWVVRKINEHLPAVDDPATAGVLQAMAAAHVANIALVDEACARVLAA